MLIAHASQIENNPVANRGGRRLFFLSLIISVWRFRQPNDLEIIFVFVQIDRVIFHLDSFAIYIDFCQNNSHRG